MQSFSLATPASRGPAWLDGIAMRWCSRMPLLPTEAARALHQTHFLIELFKRQVRGEVQGEDADEDGGGEAADLQAGGDGQTEEQSDEVQAWYEEGIRL